MDKRLLLGGVAFLIVIVVIGLIGRSIADNNAARPVVDASDAFIAALRDGHYEQAYAMCSTELQGQLKGIQGLQAIETLQAVPVRWTQKTIVNEDTSAQIADAVTFVNGRTGTSTITLNNINNVWKVVLYSYNFD